MPVVCVDETPKQLIKKVRRSLPLKPSFEEGLIINIHDAVYAKSL
jgi:hypothetical protein